MKKLLLSLVVIVGFTIVAHAQANVTSDQARVSATIVGPRSVQKTADLNFGTMVRGISGNVVVGTANNLVSSVPTHLGGTVTSAKFRVNADEGTNFSVTFPNATVTLTESVSSETITAGTFTTSLTGSAGTIAVGTTYTDFTVGSTLNIPSITQAPGVYSNNDLATGLKVTVNFP
jgi:hypothetical protein